MRRLLPLLLLASSLAGCAAPSAGQGTTTVNIHLWNCTIGESAVVTLSPSVIPTSDSKQDAKADGKVDVTVPIR